MKWLVLSTAIVWLISLWAAAGIFQAKRLRRVLRHMLIAGVFALLGLALSAILAVAHLFHAFAGETLIATVSVVRRVSPEEFEITYSPSALPPSTERKGRALPEGSASIRLRGDQWSISGGVVKWRPWLAALGLKSYHKPMWLSGRFSRLEEQRSHPPVVHPLEPGTDHVWEALYRAAPYLPFIEAAYGSSAYAYAEPGSIQEVYVSPSGYLIKRRGDREKNR